MWVVMQPDTTFFLLLCEGLWKYINFPLPMCVGSLSSSLRLKKRHAFTHFMFVCVIINLA